MSCDPTHRIEAVDVAPVSRIDPTSVAAFEAKYRAAADPWNFATSDYERERYRITLDGLRRPRYRRAFEPGCSIGELTARLAARCAQVEAADFAPTAVRQARERCKALRQVHVTCADVGRSIPDGTFDLIVFSEIGYYFEAGRLRHIGESLAARLDAGGEFIAVHWRGTSDDHVLHGDEVHAVLREHLPLTWVDGAMHAGFRLDTWSKP